MDLREISNPLEWKSLFLKGVHFLQSYAWGELKAANGNSHHYIVGSQKGTDKCAGMLLVKSVGPFRIGYIPRGPVGLVNEDAKTERKFVGSVQKVYNLDILNVDPDAFLSDEYGKDWLQLLQADRHARLVRQVQSRGTAVTNLSLIPEILSKFDKSTRYNIRKSKKDGITFNVLPASEEYMSKFYDLYVGTGGRKGFGVYKKDYYQELVRCITNDPLIDAYFGVAEHSDHKDPLSMAFLLLSGDKAFYFYAASTLNMRGSMPNYGLQWHCLNWAKDNGAKSYDWWGAPFDKENSKDSMYNVWRFKKNFLPEHKQLVGNHSLIAQSSRGYLAYTLLIVRDTFLKIRRKVKRVLLR